MQLYDVAIVGAGPAGSACASLCARAGLDVVLIDRALFPRHKVCGDCVNPSSWPLFEHLGVAGQVRALDHAVLDTVVFQSPSGTRIEVPLPTGPTPEIAVPRSELDTLLLTAATRAGATVHQGERLTATHRSGKSWFLDTDHRSYAARHLVAADGRNSTVTRLARVAPPIAIGRVAVQTHAPLPARLARKVALHILPNGYAGAADVGNDTMNLCLVCAPRDLAALRSWAGESFGLDPQSTAWHTIAPLNRKPVHPNPAPGLWVVGDAARVVEPFTGEGTYYALATGCAAARALASSTSPAAARRRFVHDCRTAYRRRLWVNSLARAAVTRPRLATALFAAAHTFPGLLPALTRTIVSRHPGGAHSAAASSTP